MKLNKFLKPTILKIAIFLFVGIVYLYLSTESVCGAGLTFVICYKAYGFPFQYLVAGDINSAIDIIKSSPLGNYFNKFEDFLLNPLSLILDLALIYLASCTISFIFEKGFKQEIRT